MTNQEHIRVLEGMRKRCTNSSSDSVIMQIAKENQTIDYAIELIKKEEKRHDI